MTNADTTKDVSVRNTVTSACILATLGSAAPSVPTSAHAAATSQIVRYSIKGDVMRIKPRIGSINSKPNIMASTGAGSTNTMPLTAKANHTTASAIACTTPMR